jgi:hypothetical protein
VDSNKISHADKRVVTNIIEDIKADYSDLVISRGEEHKFLGMNVKFNKNGSVQIGIRDYIMEAISCLTKTSPRMWLAPPQKIYLM